MSEDGELSQLRFALRPFARLGEIILSEAPTSAETVLLFTSASGEKYTVSLDVFRKAISCLRKLDDWD